MSKNSKSLYRALHRAVAIRRIIPNKSLRLFLMVLFVAVLIAGAAVGTVFLISSEDISIGVVVEALTLFATVMMLRQLFLMKDINHMEISQTIYEDDSRIRREICKAREELVDLIVDVNTHPVKNHTEFQKIYQKEDYSVLREVAFHYEYLGQLIYRQRLNFELVFDTITFPNDLFEAFFANYYSSDGPKPVNEEHEAFLKTVKQCVPDQWQGIKYLYKTYEVKRKYNAKDGKDGAKKLKEAKRQWREVYNEMPL